MEYGFFFTSAFYHVYTLTLKGRTRGEEWGIPAFSSVFFKENYYFRSCLLIRETHFGKDWRESIAMVTRYKFISNIKVKPFFNRIKAFF